MPENETETDRLLGSSDTEAIRLMAVERVSRDGERPSSVVASHTASIARRSTAGSKSGGQAGCGTESAAREAGATGRPRSLTPHQEQQVFRWVNGHDPRQYGLDFGLWARSVVAELDRAQIRHSALV